MPKGKIKMTPADYDWAAEVKKRDGWACVVCGRENLTNYINKKGKECKVCINAHHILPRELHGTKLDISNGISLCVDHHLFSRDLSAHNNPLAFFIWMEKNRPKILQYLKEKC